MTSIETITKLIGNLGLPLVIVALLIWLFYKYGPKIADAHLEFMATSSKSLKANRVLMRKLNTEMHLKTEMHLRTNAAITEACKIAEKFASDTKYEAEIREHCEAIRGLLKPEI